MVNQPARARSEIPGQFRWNAASVFASDEAWEAEANRLQEDISEVDRFRGRLSESPGVLLETVDKMQSLVQRAGQLAVSASLSYQVDTNDPDAARKFGYAQGLLGKLNAIFAFLDPELLSVGLETLTGWMHVEPQLANYRHYIEDLFRKAEHVRSQEVEQLLGMLVEPFQGPELTRTMFTDADLSFEPANDYEGRLLPLNQGNINKILASPDRTARRTAWNNYMDAHLAFKNTLASNLLTSVRQNVFLSRARRHPSSLAAALFENNIPVEVFHNLIETFRRHLPTWHRYWEIRRAALGLDEHHPYDVWAPLAQQQPDIPYQQAVEWVLAGLAPLGEGYVQTARKGLQEDGWVDVYPTSGKSSAEFSSGWPGTYPFIVMNYDDTIFSLSTLVHELGHSMHSYLAWQTQPILYSQYSLFAAEVASNFHQALVREYLLETSQDREFQISVLEEALSNFHRYFLVMPTLARFELEVHERVERGQGLAADDLNELMADLFSEGFGTQVQFDRERVGITWATFGHLYQDYYVFQYATGISGANALAQRILSGEAGAAERYLDFLKAGASQYPLDALRQAGVDLESPEPVEQTFTVLSDMVDRLEALVRANAGREDGR